MAAGRFYVVRDPEARGDVFLVWNYRRREWCFDVDGEYNVEDGFAYEYKANAVSRSKAKGVNAPLPSGNLPQNVRVVSAAGLKAHREKDFH